MGLCNLGKQTGQESPTMCLVPPKLWLVIQDYSLLPEPVFNPPAKHRAFPTLPLQVPRKRAFRLTEEPRL